MIDVHVIIGMSMAANDDSSVPWLSVIVPSHRGERWIDASLGSIAAEAAEGIEVLLIDGSPTRATVDRAAGYAQRLNLRIFERGDLASWHSKTNFGVEAAASDHVCWLGVDDIWLPGRARTVRDWIDAAPESPLHLAASAIIDRNGRRLGNWMCPLPRGTPLSPDSVIERLLVQNFVAAPAPVFRKDAWMRCGGLDPTLWYTADWDIWLKLVAAGTTYYHDVPTIGFRVHGNSLTMTGSANIVDFAEQMRTVLDRHLSRLGETAGAVAAAARASISVNAALASASAGDYRALAAAAWEICRLGPAGAARYWNHSRIADRLLPRLRAKLAGGFK
jgi:glycosyltransferase involved in cell wall biosynthesis